MNSSQISPSTARKKHLSRDQFLLVSSRLKNHESVLMVSMQPWLTVMQDNAPPHSAAKTMEEMGERAITPVSWPPNSPDLNPIEAVWDSMKDYIQFNYPSLGGGKKRSQVKLRLVVKEAWDSVASEYFVKLIETMPARC
ncbi:hypothetical protein EPUL_005487 [Erysiphe pulchra]|uniref:Tc1-like transposase DDE domain-containing protein n=1 Tax=Erysiphe pulchra TaxID=225359 RepID=A0A2S4PL21_9PEZI|nr:hypothetical protein EPUL_005487 [Erysiphe pulchra]